MSPRSGSPRDRDRLRDVNWFAYVPRHWLETPTARRLQTPRARTLVLVATVVFAALYAGALIVDDPGGTFFGALVLFFVVACLAVLAGGPAVFAPPERLDERELDQRGRIMGLAQLTSTAVLAVVCLLVGAFGFLLVGDGPIERGRVPSLMMAPLLFGLLLHTVVPVAVLTWDERHRRPDRDLSPLDDDPFEADPAAGTGAPSHRGAVGTAPVGPRRVAPDDPAARRATEQARPPAVPVEDATAAIAPDGAGLPVTHDFPVVEDPPGPPPRAAPD